MANEPLNAPADERGSCRRWPESWLSTHTYRARTCTTQSLSAPCTCCLFLLILRICVWCCLCCLPSITAWLIETALFFQVESETVAFMSSSASEKVGQVRARGGWPLTPSPTCWSVRAPTRLCRIVVLFPHCAIATVSGPVCVHTFLCCPLVNKSCVYVLQRVTKWRECSCFMPFTERSFCFSAWFNWSGFRVEPVGDDVICAVYSRPNDLGCVVTGSLSLSCLQRYSFSTCNQPAEHKLNIEYCHLCWSPCPPSGSLVHSLSPSGFITQNVYIIQTIVCLWMKPKILSWLLKSERQPSLNVLQI